MSDFTTQVRWICEQAYNTAHPDTPGTIAQYLEAGRAAIFGFQYPIFDYDYKKILETKILKHYYTREISEETVGLWKLRLDSKMNEIMPFYNKLYQSELLQFNPLYDVDVEKTGQRSGTQEKTEADTGSLNGTDAMTGTVGDSGQKSGTSSKTGSSSTDTSTTDTTQHTGTVGDSGTTSATKRRRGTEANAESGTDVETTTTDNKNDHWDYYSDTPQGTIGFIPGSEGTPQAIQQVQNQTYLTNVRHVTDDTTGSEDEKTTVYGHTTTLTLNTDETDSGTSGNTRTFNNTDSNTGSVDSDTTTSESGTTGETASNTRTYNTLNTKSNSTTASRTGSYENLDEYTEHVRGKQGGSSYSKMLIEFRETFLNIDMLIIEELGDLFFGLWG